MDVVKNKKFLVLLSPVFAFMSEQEREREAFVLQEQLFLVTSVEDPLTNCSRVYAKKPSKLNEAEPISMCGSLVNTILKFLVGKLCKIIIY